VSTFVRILLAELKQESLVDLLFCSSTRSLTTDLRRAMAQHHSLRRMPARDNLRKGDFTIHHLFLEIDHLLSDNDTASLMPTPLFTPSKRNTSINTGTLMPPPRELQGRISRPDTPTSIFSFPSFNDDFATDSLSPAVKMAFDPMDWAAPPRTRGSSFHESPVSPGPPRFSLANVDYVPRADNSTRLPTERRSAITGLPADVWLEVNGEITSEAEAEPEVETEPSRQEVTTTTVSSGTDQSPKSPQRMADADVEGDLIQRRQGFPHDLRTASRADGRVEGCSMRKKLWEAGKRAFRCVRSKVRGQ
jgi:hypothetical protein